MTHCKSMNNSKGLVDSLIPIEHDPSLTSDITRLQAMPAKWWKVHTGKNCPEKLLVLFLVLPNVFVSYASKVKHARLTCPSL